MGQKSSDFDIMKLYGWNLNIMQIKLLKSQFILTKSWNFLDFLSSHWKCSQIFVWEFFPCHISIYRASKNKNKLLPQAQLFDFYVIKFTSNVLGTCWIKNVCWKRSTIKEVNDCAHNGIERNKGNFCGFYFREQQFTPRIRRQFSEIDFSFSTWSFWAVFRCSFPCIMCH